MMKSKKEELTIIDIYNWEIPKVEDYLYFPLWNFWETNFRISTFNEIEYPQTNVKKDQMFFHKAAKRNFYEEILPYMMKLILEGSISPNTEYHRYFRYFRSDKTPINDPKHLQDRWYHMDPHVVGKEYTVFSCSTTGINEYINEKKYSFVMNLYMYEFIEPEKTYLACNIDRPKLSTWDIHPYDDKLGSMVILRVIDGRPLELRENYEASQPIEFNFIDTFRKNQ